MIEQRRCSRLYPNIFNKKVSKSGNDFFPAVVRKSSVLCITNFAVKTKSRSNKKELFERKKEFAVVLQCRSIMKLTVPSPNLVFHPINLCKGTSIFDQKYVTEMKGLEKKKKKLFFLSFFRLIAQVKKKVSD